MRGRIEKGQRLSPETEFKPGNVPWNKGMRGLRTTSATKFKRGNRPANWVPVGTVRIRTTKRDGKKCAWVKVAEPNKWRQRRYVVWERAGGPELPPGHFLHYCDGDTLNDTLTNLQVVDRAYHMNLHRPEFEERRRLASRMARHGW